MKERCGLEPQTNFFFRLSNRQKLVWIWFENIWYNVRVWKRCVWLRADSVNTAMNLPCQQNEDSYLTWCANIFFSTGTVSRDFVSTGLNRWLTIWRASWCASQLVHPVSIIRDCPVWTPAQHTAHNRALLIRARRHSGSQRWKLFVFVWRNRPPVGQGLLIHEASRPHTTTRHSR